jgi:hypothetical protein
MNWIINNAWAFWAGAGIAITGTHIVDWQWWAFCLPLVTLVAIRDHFKEKQDERN